MSDQETYLGWRIDYGQPAGEPALVPPGSMHWRVYKNPIALGIGGVAAVLLEFADARVRSGVWDHSTFKADPIGRSKRTGTAALLGVYGPRSAAQRVIQSINKMHAKVKGTTPDGRAYHALDPELLDWVAATAAYGFLNAYDRFVNPLSEADQERFYSEGAALAGLYGAETLPASPADFLAMLDARAHLFEPHAIVHEFVAIIESGKAAPSIPRFLHRAAARASISLLPPLLRDRLELGRDYDLTLADRLALKTIGRVADRVVIPDSPPCQASVRLGLPADFLYRGERARERMLEEAGLLGGKVAAAA